MTITLRNNTIYETKRIKFYETFIEFLQDYKLINIPFSQIDSIT
jgi:hypothetical protein